MGENTKISWASHTFNLWWGCWKIAEECRNCYAAAFANRFRAQYGDLWQRTGPRRFFGDNHWDEPRRWNAKAKAAGKRDAVFVGSMCDWAEVHPDPEINRQMDAYRGRLFEMIRELDSLDWMLLSKRVDDIDLHLPWLQPPPPAPAPPAPGAVWSWKPSAPWSNVWIGVTAGTRDTLRYNAPRLRSISAAGHFISCEPMLEDIPAEDWDDALDPCARCGEERVDLVIVGEESGHHRRAGNLDAVRVARDACDRHGVGFHLKQWHEDDKLVHLPLLDGVQHTERI